MSVFDEYNVASNSVFDQFQNTILGGEGFPLGGQNQDSSLEDKYLSEFAKTMAFGSLRSAEINANYFVGISPIVFTNKMVIQEDESKIDIDPRKFTLYKDKNDLKGYQEGEDEFLYSLKVYVSTKGDKLRDLHGKSQPGPDEVLLFLEDNTNDYSNQVLLAKFGKNVDKKELIKVSNDGVDKFTSLVPGLSKQSFRELIIKGVVVSDGLENHSLVKGFLYVFDLLSAIPKFIGDIADSIGDGIKDFFSVPEKVWNSDSDEYVFKKENLIKTLQIEKETIDNIFKGLEQNSFYVSIMPLVPDSVQAIPKNIRESIQVIISKYNSYVVEVIDGIYQFLENPLKELDESFYITERIALLAGAWNGAVDFISGIFKFVALILKIPSFLINNFQEVLEVFDSIWESLKEISIKDLFEASQTIQILIFVTLYKFITTENKSEIYNFDKIAYYTGFGVVFILSMFIPGTAVLKVAKVDKLIPDEFFDILRSLQKESVDFVKDKSNKVFRSALKAMREISEILAKGKDEIVAFFKRIIDQIVEWFKKNGELLSLENLLIKLLDELIEAAANTKRILQDLGVSITRISPGYEPQLVGEPAFRVMRNGEEIVTGTKEAIKAFAKKIDDIVRSSKRSAKENVRKHLDDLSRRRKEGKLVKLSTKAKKLLDDFIEEAISKWRNIDRRPGVGAILEGVVNGKTIKILKYSAKGIKKAELDKLLHPLVKEWLSDIAPLYLRNRRTHGKCAEPLAISEFLFMAEKVLKMKKGTMTVEKAREVLSGSVSKAKRIYNSKDSKLAHGLHKSACKSCNPLLKYFEIIEDLN